MTLEEAKKIVEESQSGIGKYSPDELAQARGILLGQAERDYEKWKEEQKRDGRQ